MRIIAGRFKGYRLPSPAGHRIRPTTDRVREALFSTLGEDVVGRAVLELFAGTGALGLEALSRGAASAVFVDRDRKTVQNLSHTVEALGIGDVAQVLHMDAIQAITELRRTGRRFGLIFLDPPYDSGWLTTVVAERGFEDLMKPEGLLVVERSANGPGGEMPAFFRSRFARKYGDTMVEIFRYEAMYREEKH